MAIFKKGITQAQKSKSIIIIIVMAVLFSIPIYNIGKKLLSYIGFSKLPVLACVIDGHHMTYDLRKYEIVRGSKKNYKEFSDKIILNITDDEYAFAETVDQGDGTVRMWTYNVNRYSGVINVYISPKHARYGEGSLGKALRTEVSYNGICKGAK